MIFNFLWNFFVIFMSNALIICILYYLWQSISTKFKTNY